MKNYKLIINWLLISSFILSVVAFGVISKMTSNYWYAYNEIYADILQTSQNIDHINEIKAYYSQTLCLTFSVIFSALSTLASAVTFCLLNFKVWKKN